MPLTGPEAQRAAERLLAIIQTTGWSDLNALERTPSWLPLVLTAATLAIDGREVEFATGRVRLSGKSDLLLFVEGSVTHATVGHEPAPGTIPIRTPIRDLRWSVTTHRLSDVTSVEYKVSKSILTQNPPVRPDPVVTWPAGATATLRLRTGLEWEIPFETGLAYAANQSAFLQTLAKISRSLGD